jgi:hypothetical protein
VRRVITLFSFGSLFVLACEPKGPSGDDSGTGESGNTESGESSAGTGDGDGDGDSESSTSFTSSTTFTTGMEEYECPNGEFPPGMVPASVMGTVDDGFLMMNESPCAAEGANGQEVVYTFTAPMEGFYEFDTVGSGGDTVLHIREATCEGKIIACGDDSDFEAMVTQSNVGVYLMADEVIQVVVDHKLFAPMGTAVVANVKSVSGDCPEETIMGTLPIKVSGSTAGKTNKITGSCFGEGPDITYAWTVPEDGTYKMDIDTCPYQDCQDPMGFLYDSVLYVIDGTNCGGEELACNDDVLLGMMRDSSLTVDLTMGQDVIIVVDGWSGTEGMFDLNITKQ